MSNSQSPTPRHRQPATPQPQTCFGLLNTELFPAEAIARIHAGASQRHAFGPQDLVGSGGANRDRTGDLLLAKQALSQLSYGPEVFGLPAAARDADRPPSLLRASARQPSLLTREGWWAREDLNFRPHAYQARALTS